MASVEASYLPPDRLRALASSTPLPRTAEGSALFADISGFTPITERLRVALGSRRGAEALALQLNRVYDALIAEVERFGGSVIGFAGDAVTCWFEGAESALHAAACGFALLSAMRTVEEVLLPDGDSLRLELKVALASGTTQRFVIGDPDIQQIDTLAGAVVARLAAGEGLAERGELLADAATVERLGDAVRIREWRDEANERFAVLEAGDTLPDRVPPAAALPVPSSDELRHWMLPALVSHIQAGLGEFQIELRPVTVLFLRFTGIDYDDDPAAHAKLHGLVSLVQRTAHRYEGSLLQLTIGDKGSYLYAAFGAPAAHEDDTARALNAALEIRDGVSMLDGLEPVQIGISRGVMRTGAYGSATRRTYGVLGDEVNLAARLMVLAEPGTILLSESLLSGLPERFALEPLTPIRVKGKSAPQRVFRLIGLWERAFESRFYTTPMVGRDDELAALRTALQPIFDGRHAGVFLVYGEPGMGKSRLAFEVQRRLHDEGVSVTWLTGQAEALRGAPLSVFTYFLRPYFGQRRERDFDTNRTAFDAAFDALLPFLEEPARADLEFYRSFLAGLVGLVIPGSPYEASDEKLRLDNTVAALKAWARAESQRQPLVLHLEDAQWLDSVSIRAIQQLTANMETTPLALLLTSRYNDDGSPFTIANIRDVTVRSIDLNRLSEAGIAAVASAVLNGAIRPVLARFLRERAEGNPFFTEQLVLDLRERGALIEMQGEWDLRPDAAAEVPAGVNAVLIARLDRLAARVKSVVQTASVLGREFDVLVLSRMLREAEMPAVREAEREAIWASLDEIRYLFRHALLRDAAYQMQAQARLQALHRLAAETIEALYTDDLRQSYALVEHWHAAGALDNELRHLERVLPPLVALQGQYADVLRLTERALKRLDDDDARRIWLLNNRTFALRMMGSYPAARETATEALRLAEQKGDSAAIAESLFRLGQVAHSIGDYTTAHESFERSRTLFEALGNQAEAANLLHGVEQKGDSAAIAESLFRLGQVAHSIGDYTTAHESFERSRTLFEALGNQAEAANLLHALGINAYYQGDITTAKTNFRSALAVSRETGSRMVEAKALNGLGVILMEQGALLEALDHMQQSLATARETGDQSTIGNTTNNLGNVLWRLGRSDEALEYYTKALARAREAGEPWSIGIGLHNLGFFAASRKKYSQALGYYQQALTVRREIGDRWGLAGSLFNLACIHANQGSYREASQRFHEVLALQQELPDKLGMAITLEELSLTQYEQGLYGPAREHLLEHLSLCRELELQARIPSAVCWLGDIEFALGEDERARAAYAEALSLFYDGIDAHRRMRMLMSMAYFALAERDYPRAHDLLGQAEATSQSTETAGGNISIRFAFGVFAWHEGDYNGAAQHLEEALDAARMEGESYTSSALYWLARTANQQGRLAEARAYWRESVTRLLPDEGWRDKTTALLIGAEILSAQGDAALAAEAVGQVREHAALDAPKRREAEALRDALAARLPPDEFSAALARGQAAELDPMLERLLVAFV